MNLQTLTAALAASATLALSDGTPVEFVKITKKDNIQVRVPTSHDKLGDDPLRIFRRDGTHYKDETDLTLTVVNTDAVAPAAATPAPATPAAAQISANDNTFYTVNDQQFDNLEDAKQEAVELFRDGFADSVEIVATTRKVIGVVGIQLAA